LAREFEPTANTIRKSIQQAERDAKVRTAGLTGEERPDLPCLRREARRLKEEREILEKAAAWLAREVGSIPERGSNS
jgi:transposase